MTLPNILNKTSIEWMESAICHGQMHLFFAKVAERPEARVRREAKAASLCSACPVSAECREYGRQNHEYGFWGGENEEQRNDAGFILTAGVGFRHRNR